MRENPRTGFLGKVSSLSQAVSAKAAEAVANVPSLPQGPFLTLLVIDNPDTDWARYFRGRKVGDFDVRVEQAKLSQLTVMASSGAGVVACTRECGRSSGPFKPDFLLIRQNLRDAGKDYRKLLLGFQYGQVPCLNSLQSVYNFQDKPWVYAHLLDIQRRIGADQFPLIPQTYHPDHTHMDEPPAFPCVLKVGHAHGGLGKVKVEGETSWKDLASVVAVSGQYCTVEEYIDAKYDLHIFKLGDCYRAMIASHCCDCRRKSLSGNWKTSVGQSILEEVPVQDKYRLWIDQVSEMFGGLDICSLEAVVGKDGQEVIIEVNDCALNLMGESQEEDRKQIAEMVVQQMEVQCLPATHTNGVVESTSKNLLEKSTERAEERDLKGEERKEKSLPGPIQRGPQRRISSGQDSYDSTASSGSTSSVTSSTSRNSRDSAKQRGRVDQEKGKNLPGPLQRGPQRRRSASQASTGSTSSDSSRNSGDSVKCREVEQNDQEEATAAQAEGEDTMKNLRTTFAGIFGESRLK